jgi:glycine/D-amino acid oxidase-like deaminating enzyme
MAPGVGRVMADLVLEGRDDIPGEFRPEASSLPLSASRSSL